MGIQCSSILFRLAKTLPSSLYLALALLTILGRIISAILARMSQKNIVIFGETGSGKSSIVNMLLGRKVAEVSDAAVGCTFHFQRYKSKEYTFYDTVGLSEGSRGSLSSKQALSNLIKLLKSLEDGVSLLIFVVEKGRIKTTLEENYKLFVNTICMKKVPVILVITHCEQELVVGQWWEENKKHFDNYGMTFEDTVCGCASTGEGLLPIFANTMKSRYDDTKLEIYKSIGNNYLAKPWKMSSWPMWLSQILKKVWNLLCLFFNWTPIPYLPQLTDIFMEQGHDEKSATILGNNIYTSFVS